MPANTEHYVGGTKHFECRVKGHPRPQIRWFKDGKDITDKPRFKFDVTHEGVISMVIDNITHDDEGHYRCRAENCEGLASTSAYLFVRASKDHPQEAETSIHAMAIEEAVVFDDKEKERRRLSKSNVTEPHFETPIQDTEQDPSQERRLSTEEEEIVKKTFESVLESSESVRKIAYEMKEETRSEESSEQKSDETDSFKIKADALEKSYQSSDDDMDSVRLQTISERSETISSIQEALRDFEQEEKKSLLMSNTAKLLSSDFSDDEDISKQSGDFDSDTQSVFSTKESKTSSEALRSQVELTTTSEALKNQVELTTTSEALKTQVESTSNKVTTSKHKESTTASKDGTLVIKSEMTSVESVETTTDKDGKDVERESTSSSVQVVKATEIVNDASITKVAKKDVADEVEDTGSGSESDARSSVESVVSVEGKNSNIKVTDKQEKPDGDTDAPHFTMTPKNINIKEYENIKLSCEVTGNPSPKLTWYRNDKQVRSNRRTRIYESMGVHYLEIHDCDAQDIGQYVCQASNSKGENSASVKVTMTGVTMEETVTASEEQGQSEPMTLMKEEDMTIEEKDVPSAPRFIDAITDTTTCKAGETLKLEIGIKGFPRPDVSWSKDGKKFKSGDRMTISYEKEVCTLEITNVKASDSGYYHLSARNDKGDASTDVKVVVTGEAQESKKKERKEEVKVSDVPEFTTTPESLMFMEYDDIKLSCSVIGDPTPSITWEKDGKPLRSNRRTRLFESMGINYLQIKDCDIQDMGQYTCIASNSKGTSKYSVHVKMEGAEGEGAIKDKKNDAFEDKDIELKPVSTGKDDITLTVEETNELRVYDSAEEKLIVKKQEETTNVSIPTEIEKIKENVTQEKGVIEDKSQSQEVETVTEETVSKDKDEVVGEMVIIEDGKTEDESESSINEVKSEDTILEKQVDEENIRMETESVEENASVGKLSDATFPPETDEDMEEVSVLSGSCLKLNVEVDGNLSSVEWSKDGKTFKEDRRVSIVFDGGETTLEIRDTKSSDAGTYTLVATTDLGEVSTDINVTVESDVSTSVEKTDEQEILKPVADVDVEVDVPTFTVTPADIEVAMYEDIKLSCSVSGNPPPKITWEKDGKRIRSNRRTCINENMGVHSLTIRDCDALDLGEYICAASNDKGSVKVKVHVNMEGTQDEDSTQRNDDGPFDDKDIRLKRISSDEDKTMGVEKTEPVRVPEEENGAVKSQGETIEVAVTKEMHEVDGNQTRTEVAAEMEIVTKSKEEVAEEMVSVNHKKVEEKMTPPGTLEAKTVETVLSKEEVEEEKQVPVETSQPQILEEVDSVSFIPGSSLKLTVTTETESSPPRSSSWAKDGVTLKEGERVKIIVAGAETTLEIKDTKSSDAGVYTMTATTDHGKVSTDIRVTVDSDVSISDKNAKEDVTLKPVIDVDVDVDVPTFTVTPEDIEVAMYEDIKLSCSLSGNPPPKITWEKDGKRIRSNRRTCINENMGVHSLTIRDCDALDLGEYICTASNDKGSVKVKVHVKMEGTEDEEATKRNDDGAFDDKDIRLKRIPSDEDKTVGVEKTEQVRVPEEENGAAKNQVAGTKEKHEVDGNQTKTEVIGEMEIVTKSKEEVAEEMVSVNDNKAEEKMTPPGTLEAKTVETVLSKEEVEEEKQVPVETSKPQILEEVDSVSFIPGSSLKLTVTTETESSPPRSLSWAKDGETLKEGERVNIIVAGVETTLEIKDTKSSDAGVYTMTATTDQGKVSTDIRVAVDSDVSISYKKAKEDERLTPSIDVDAPRISVPIENICVAMYEDIKLSCSVTGDPKPSITWEKDGKRIRSNRRTRMYESLGVHYLEIRDTDALDLGEYACIVSNDKGTATATITVTMEGMETVADTKPVLEVQEQGETFNGEEISDLVEEKLNKTKEETEQQTLKCADEITSSKSETKILEEGMKVEELEESIRMEPKIVKLDDVFAESGTTLKLQTQIKGSPQLNVSWSKDGKELQSGKRITMATENDIHTLNIQEVEQQDSGRYRLTAHNASGDIFSDVTVAVVGDVTVSAEQKTTESSVITDSQMPQFTMIPQDVSVSECETIKLSCTVSGDPKPTVTWEKDGKQLRANRRLRLYESRGVHYLEKTDSDTLDAGKYTCSATNIHGTNTATVHVMIEGMESSFYSTTEEVEDAATISTAAKHEDTVDSSADEHAFKTYKVITSHTDVESNVTLTVGDLVEVLDSRQTNGNWLIRVKGDPGKVCFVPQSIMKIATEPDMDEIKKDEESDEEEASLKKKGRKSIHSSKSNSMEFDMDTSEDDVRLRGIFPAYVAIADYIPPEGEMESVRLTEGQIVEVIDKERPDLWLLKTRPTKTCPSKEGWVPSAYLEEKSSSFRILQRSTKESFREDVLQVSNKQHEAGLKKRYVLKEMEETEREYIKELKGLIDGHKALVKKQPESLSEAVIKNAETIFSNIDDIFNFHDSQFLAELGECVTNPVGIGAAFLKWKCDFENYIKYWADREHAAYLLETDEMQDFFKEFSSKTSNLDESLLDLLRKPTDRLKTYQLLLKDVLRYSVRAGENVTDLEAAISMLISIEKAVGDGKLLPLLDGIEGDITQLGNLIRHDDFCIWEGEVSTSRMKDRHVFLFDDKLILTKKKKSESSSDQQGFSYKSAIDLSAIRLKDSVPEDERRFELWFVDHSATEKITLQARSVYSKKAWTRDIREALLKLGISEPDRMPEKTAETQEEKVAASDTDSPTEDQPKVKDELQGDPQELTPKASDSELESDVLSKTDLDATDGDTSTFEADTAPDTEEDNTSPPYFTLEPKTVVCSESGTARLECVVGGGPTPSVKWYKGEKRVLSGFGGVELQFDNGVSSITFSKVTARNAGIYTVTISNQYGNQSLDVELVVLEEADREPINSETTEAESEFETVTEEAESSDVKESFEPCADKPKENTDLAESTKDNGSPEKEKTETKQEEVAEPKTVQEEVSDKETKEKKITQEENKEETDTLIVLEEELSKDLDREATQEEVKATGTYETEELKESIEDKSDKTPDNQVKNLSETELIREEDNLTLKTVDITETESFKTKQEPTEEEEVLETGIASAGEEVTRTPDQSESYEQAKISAEELSIAESITVPDTKSEKVVDLPEEHREETAKPEQLLTTETSKIKTEEVETINSSESEVSKLSEKEVKAETSPEAEVPKSSEKESIAETSPEAEVPKPSEKESKAETSPEAEVPKPSEKEVKAETSPEAEVLKPSEKEVKAETSPEAEVLKPSEKEVKAETSPEAEVPKPSEKEVKAETSKPSEKEVKAETSLEAEVSKPTEKESKVETSPEAELSKPSEKEVKAETSLEAEVPKPSEKEVKAETSPEAEVSKPTVKEVNVENSHEAEVREETQVCIKATEVEKESVQVVKKGTLLPETTLSLTDTQESESESSIYSDFTQSDTDLKLSFGASIVGKSDSKQDSLTKTELRETKNVLEEKTYTQQDISTSATLKRDKDSVEDKSLDSQADVKLERTELQETESVFIEREVDFSKESKEERKLKDLKPAAPQVIEAMDDCVIELGDLARFDCRVSAYPDPDITWFKDGHKVIPSERYELLNFHDDIFSLLIKSVDRRDSGMYTCLAKNVHGEAKSEAILNVLVPKEKIQDAHVAPAFLTKFYDIEAIEGVPVEFVCVIDGQPDPKVTWILNGKEVENTSELLTRRQDESIMLAFRSVQTQHSGEIICKLKNDSGEAMCKARLCVKEDITKKGDRPLFLERPSDTEVSEGGEVTFECVISGIPEPEVTWFFNGRELHESRRRTIRRRAGQKFSLSLREIIPENAGVYTCKAVNKVGDSSCAVELSVKELPTEQFLKGRTFETNMGYDTAKYAFPPSFTRQARDLKVLPGRMARFECMVIGVPEPEVEWQKDGFPLKWGPKYKVGREGHTAVLVVESCDTIDEGTYTCNLFNEAGKATCSARLSVQEERTRQSLPRFTTPGRGYEAFRETSSTSPRKSVSRYIAPEDKIPCMPIDKPTLLEVKPNAAKLSWMPAPTSILPENAQKITYVIEARELPSKNWVRLDGNIEATTHFVYGLKADKEYTFRVRAENRYGVSDPCLPCSLLPREVPKQRDFIPKDWQVPTRPVLPKTRPYVSHIGKETIQVGWKPAEIPYKRATSMPPVSYRVEAQKLPSEEWVPLASRIKKPSLYLSDLEPNRDYNIRIRAQTPYGISQPTEPLWIPRAKAFTGVPVTRPTIVEIDEDSARLAWNKVNIPAFDKTDEPLMYMIEMQEPPSYRWRELARRVPNNYFIVRDLEQGQDYRFRVRAESREGLLSEPSPTTSIFRTLALTHSPVDRLEIEEYDPESESVRLQWRKVEVPPFTDRDSPLLYMIEYENPQVEGWRPLVSGVPTTRYRVPDLSPSDDYRFRVRALTPYGTSPPSHPIGLYRKKSPIRPLAQDLKISEMQPEGVRLSWRSVSVPPSRAAAEPLSYQIEAMEYPKREWRPLASNICDTNYRLSGLKSSSDYSFRVRGQTPSGLLEPTAPITLTSLPVRPRLQSNDVSLHEVSSESVRLQWKPAELPYYSRHTSPISYTVEYQESPSREWNVASRRIPDTTYTMSGLKSDRNYHFRVRPETDEGPGEFSLPVNTYRRPAPVLPFREPRLTNIAPSSATLTWQPATLTSGIPTRPIVYRIEAREPPRSQWYEVAGRVPSSSYDLQFLHPDQDYMFRVIADYDSVLSEPTMAVYLPRRAGPPKMPREAPFVSNVQPESLILSWKSVELPSRITDYSPVTYRVEVQEHPRMDWQPLARQITQTHFHATRLRPDLDYSFRIRAENEFGISDPTEARFICKRAIAPTIAQHEPLISDVRSDSVRLTWQPAEIPLYLTDSVPVTYNILMQESGDSQWQPIVRRVAGTSYYVTGLSPDKDYSFRVQASNDFGTSIPSMPADLRRQFQGPVYIPHIDDVEPSSFRLSWKQPSLTKKATYSIETLEPSTWKWRPLVSRLPHPSFRVADVQPNKDYAFRVRTEIDSKLSEPSMPISFSSRRGLPTFPVERPTLSELYDDSVKISWHPTLYHGTTKRSAPQAYRLEVRELPSSYWRTLVPSTQDWSYEVTDLRPNQDYAFRVRTVTDSGMSEPSLPVFLYKQSVTPKVPLPSPEIGDVGDDYIHLRWKSVDVPAFEPDEKPLSFMIEAQRVPDYEWRPVARGISSPSHKVTGLQPGEDYRFRIRGETPIGITQPSAPIPVYRKPLRSGIPITNLSIDSDSNQPYSARLRWNPVYIHPYTATKDTTYFIEMQEPPRRDWYTLARDVPSTTYTVPDLSPRRDYLFRIRARSSAGEYSAPTPPIPYYRDPSSSWDALPRTDTQVETVSPIHRPYIEGLILKVPPRMSIEKPEMIAISPDIVKLSWKSARVPSATAHLSPTKYRVEVRHEDSFEWVEKADGIVALNTTIKGLHPHVDYAFRVRAVNDFGWSESTLPVFLHRPQDLKDEAAEMEFEEYEVSGSLLGDTCPPKMPIDTPKMVMMERDRLKLSWSTARIPVYARKTPITYIVEKKETADLDWVPVASAVSDTHYTIESINGNTDYLFRVRAENEFGKSEATLPAALTRSRGPSLMRSSASRERDTESMSSSRRSSYSYIDSLSEGVPPRVPNGRPVISDVSETSLTLSWPAARMPTYINKKVKILYIVERREPPNHLWMKINENVDGCEHKVTNLRGDQDYMFRVRAFNDSGMSEPTLPVTLTRDRTPEVEPRTMRRRSSVERFSSVERRTSRERSLSMERSVSIPRGLSRENSKKEVEENELFMGQTPDTTPLAPEFLESKSPTLQYGIDSRPVKITLQLKGLPLPNVDWYFNDKKIMYGDRHEGYITPAGLVVLEFTPMMWSDVGEYKCVAENELGEISLTVKLEIADPPTFMEPMKDLLLQCQTSGQFSCRVDGIPRPSIKFMKDWRAITETTRLQVANEGDRWTVDIEKAIPADSGCYICMAENVAGKVFCTARLSVDDEEPKSVIFYKTSKLEDDYYILEELGRGRHSIVRRVIKKSTGKEFAAKITQVREEEDKEFFRQELNALIRQDDAQVERLHDAYETKRQLILVVDLIKHGTLLDRICQDDQWSEAKAAQTIKYLIQALDAVHKTNMVHLDIKPQNILMKSEDYDSLTLIDFGFARKLPLSSDLTFNYGTPEFSSPEAVNDKAITQASDMWAVGVITHILLSGVSPFYAPTIPETLSRVQTCNWKLDDSLFSNLSNSCKDFILNLLINEPDSRLTAESCLAHDWLKMADNSDSQKIDNSPIKAFCDRRKEEKQATSVRTVATLQSLKRLLDGTPVVQGLVPEKDPQTGEVVLPDTEKYGMYLDEESWYEWQSRHQQGPDSELFPMKDAQYTARVRSYKRTSGSVDDPAGPPIDSDEELDPKDKERMLTMKERKTMAEIDQEEIPPSLQKELEWLEETKKRRKSRDPDEFSISSKRSSIVSMSIEGVPGPVFKEKLHDMAFEVGDTVIMRCVVAGPPTPTCVWYKNEELLSDGNRVKMNLEEDGEATLTIRNAKPYDAGVYKCVGRNKYGRISNRMRLMQGDCPGRPGRPVVSQTSSTEAVVIWEAPRFEGNSGILFYKLDYKAKGNVRWITGAYTPEEAAVVSNLEPDTKYTFRVSATNRIGTGHYSWASTDILVKPEGSLPITADSYVDLSLLKSLQSQNQPALPSEYDDIIPEGELGTEKREIKIQQAHPDSLYNVERALYKGKFYEVTALTLPSENDKQFTMRTILSSKDQALHEINTVKELDHERVLKLVSVFEADKQMHLIFEHVESEHVAHYLSHHRKYSENTVALIIRQVLFGLEYLHRNRIVHLNLQPASVLVSQRERCEIKITDFSCARKIVSPDGESIPRLGYADFIAPEVVVKDLVGFPADIWGIGALTFLLLSGVSPFQGQDYASTLVNVALCRYDAADLYENITQEALKFLYKVMKRLPENRLTMNECLDHKWLLLSDKYVKEKEDAIFTSNTLATFVQEYDAIRQKEDFQQDFQDLVLPIQMATILPYEERAQRKASQLKSVEFERSQRVQRKDDSLTLEDKFQIKADKLAKEKSKSEKQKPMEIGEGDKMEKTRSSKADEKGADESFNQTSVKRETGECEKTVTKKGQSSTEGESDSSKEKERVKKMDKEQPEEQKVLGEDEESKTPKDSSAVERIAENVVQRAIDEALPVKKSEAEEKPMS